MESSAREKHIKKSCKVMLLLGLVLTAAEIAGLMIIKDDLGIALFGGIVVLASSILAGAFLNGMVEN